jgi:hypothetical protein
VSISAIPHAHGYQKNLRMCIQKSSDQDRFLHAIVFGQRNSTKLGTMSHNYRTIDSYGCPPWRQGYRKEFEMNLLYTDKMATNLFLLRSNQI